MAPLIDITRPMRTRDGQIPTWIRVSDERPDMLVGRVGGGTRNWEMTGEWMFRGGSEPHPLDLIQDFPPSATDCTAEERAAWVAFAAACSGSGWHSVADSDEKRAHISAARADALLAEYRKRFPVQP